MSDYKRLRELDLPCLPFVAEIRGPKDVYLRHRTGGGRMATSDEIALLDALEAERDDARECAKSIDDDLRAVIAASRERWKAESERADRLWQECENLRIRLADAQHRPVVDKSGDSQGRMRRCIGCEGFYLPAYGHTCAHTTIPPEIATPDSAASPTGGAG